MTPLAPPNPQGYPAPLWLLEALKVLGLWLHAMPMNLWYAGTPVAVVLAVVGGARGRRLSRRLAMVMPIAIALGVNFGVVPLLFTQAVNYRFYYTTGVLIAWPWLSVIPLVMLAYYAAYLHAESRRPRVALAGGAASAVMLLAVGFLFANNFSLMTNPGQWLAIFRRTAVAGAPTGLALNVGDPTLLPRWLMMFGLAITTVAAYIVLDSAFFARREQQEYRDWAGRFAFRLYTLGLLWFAVTGTWYIFGTLPQPVVEAMQARPVIVALMALTAVAPGLPWVLIAAWRRFRSTLPAALAVAGQMGVIGINAVSRQWVQNVELRPYADLAAARANPQWVALGAFGAAMVVAICLVVWMVARLHSAWAAEQPPASAS